MYPQCHHTKNLIRILKLIIKCLSRVQISDCLTNVPLWIRIQTRSTTAIDWLIYLLCQLSSLGSPSIFIFPPPWKFYVLVCLVCPIVFSVIWILLFAYPWYSLTCSLVSCVISNLVVALGSLIRFRILFRGMGHN